MEGYELITADCVESSKPVELFSIEKQKSRLVLANENIVEDTKIALEESVGWLPLFAELYNISPKLSDFVLVPVVIMPSDLPNRNAQAFPLSELVRANTETGQLGYETWARKPTHLDHCFPGDAPIITNKGVKYIKNIKKGDMVLSHNRVFQKVLNTFNNGTKWIKEVKCFGLPEPIKVTENHPMWVIDARQVYGEFQSMSSVGGFRKRKFDSRWEDLKPHFRPMSDVYVGDYMCVPIAIGGDIEVDKYFAFLTGIHMAEGCYSWYKGKPVTVLLTIGYTEKKLKTKIEKCLNSLNLKYSVYYHRVHNVCVIAIRDREFAEKMFKMTGNFADKKQMRGELRNWNKESMKWFLGGYISGDGSVGRWGKTDTKNKKMRCRSSSKQLSIDIWHSLGFVGVASTVVHDGKPKTYTYYCSKYDKIRTIQEKGSYAIGAVDFEAYILNDYIINKPKMLNRNSNRTQQKVMLKGNYFITPVYSIVDKFMKEKVYNIEVANDNSYIAYNIAVHNCNHDYTKAKGIIFSSSLKPIKNSEGGLMKVVALLGFDRSTQPIISNDILTGQKTAYSMGCWAREFQCAYCGATHRSSQQGCEHISLKAPRMRKMSDNKLVYLQAKYINGFEVSVLNGKPAFSSAVTPHTMLL